MTLQQLTYFLAAADHGSFSAAADSLLHLAQPSLSEQIRRLEAELGVPLFVRAGRGVELTEAGRLFQPHAERTLAEARGGAESVREIRDAHRRHGRVRLLRRRPPHAARSAGGRTSAPATPRCACAPSARTPPRWPTPCATGSLEAGLVILPVDDTRARGPRGAHARSCCTSPPIPSACKQPMTIERLADAPLILYDARWAAQDPTRRMLRERAQRAGVRLEPLIEVEYMTAALDLAARGLGDTVSLRSLLTARGVHAPARHRRRSTRRSTRRFAFITRRDAHLTPAARAFMALAERRVQALA